MRRPFHVALLIVLSAVLCVTVLGASTSSAHPGGHSHKVFAPTSHPYDLGYSRWLARWAKWIQETPNRDFPGPNSPSNCDVHGRAVFMGPLGSAGCTIPAEKLVAVQPFLQYECSTAEGNGETYRQLRRCAVKGFRGLFGRDNASVHVRVDGKRLERPRRWTITSMGRVVDLPRDNIWDAPPGPTKSIMHGLFYLVKPLGPGDHEFRLRADYGRQSDVYKYEFTVRG